MLFLSTGVALLSAAQLISAAPRFISESSQVAIAEDTLRSATSGITLNEVHGVLNYSDYTILEILDAALHRDNLGDDEEDNPATLPLHRLAYLVNKSADARASLEADDITLLAPDDKALTPPKHNNGVDAAEHHAHHPFHHADSEEHGGDKERKERFAKIVAYILKYHTLPTAYSSYELADHSTVGTSLASGRDDAEPLRVRVEPSYILLPLPHPSLQFNFYSYKRGPTVIAKNGVIHLVSAPLLPPFTPLNNLFLFPQVYSSLTSGLQKIGLDSVILPVEEKIEFGDMIDGPKSVVQEIMEELLAEAPTDFTLFAPTNLAFDKLGFKTVAFLHSPLRVSKRVLKYILAYHVVPDVAFFSDYSSNSSAVAEFKIGESVQGNANVTHYELPTLLSKSGVNKNATLLVDVVVSRGYSGKGALQRQVIVIPHRKADGYRDEPTKVWKADAVSRHGAIHGLNSVLIPPYERQHHEDASMEQALAQVFA